MAVDDTSGTVTIAGTNLRADADGLLVANPFGRNRRIAWTEISHFADGRVTDGKGDVVGWRLVIVLHTGKQVPVVRSALDGPARWWPLSGRQPSPMGYPPTCPGFRRRRTGGLLFAVFTRTPAARLV